MVYALCHDPRPQQGYKMEKDQSAGQPSMSEIFSFPKVSLMTQLSWRHSRDEIGKEVMAEVGLEMGAGMRMGLRQGPGVQTR